MSFSHGKEEASSIYQNMVNHEGVGLSEIEAKNVCLHAQSRTDKFIETGSRLEVTRACRKRKEGHYHLIAPEILFGVMKNLR